MNDNAPYIREIIGRTNQIKGIWVQGGNKAETKENVLLILQNNSNRQQIKMLERRHIKLSDQV